MSGSACGYETLAKEDLIRLLRSKDSQLRSHKQETDCRIRTLTFQRDAVHGSQRSTKIRSEPKYKIIKSSERSVWHCASCHATNRILDENRVSFKKTAAEIEEAIERREVKMCKNEACKSRLQNILNGCA